MADYSFDDQSDIAQFTTRHTMRKPDPVFKYDSEDPLDYWSDDWTPLMASDVKDSHLEDSHGWDDMRREMLTSLGLTDSSVTHSLIPTKKINLQITDNIKI